MEIERVDSFLTKGFDVNEGNINILKGKTFYGKSYEVGDHINYVFVITGMDDEGFIIELKTLADSEAEKFQSEHTLYDNNKFVPNWMIPEDEPTNEKGSESTGRKII